MCSTPDVEEPTQLQASKAPVFNTTAKTKTKTGRQGTILSGATAGQSYAPDGKRTLLGG